MINYSFSIANFEYFLLILVGWFLSKQKYDYFVYQMVFFMYK